MSIFAQTTSMAYSLSSCEINFVSLSFFKIDFVFRMVASGKDTEQSLGISEEEQAFRKEEAALLKKMSGAPVVGDDVLKLLVHNKKLAKEG